MITVTGALFVDLGQARRDGTWLRPPRARYECLICRTTEGPVTGDKAVTRFVPTIRQIHRDTCPGHPTQQGAHAA